jgi:hypothetical protein
MCKAILVWIAFVLQSCVCMTLPSSRDETIVAGGQVSASLLNNLQDCVVNEFHPTRTVALTAAEGNADTGWDDAFSPDYRRTNSAGNALVFGLQVPLGHRLTAVRVHVEDVDASNYVQVKLWRKDFAAATSTQVGSTQTSGKAGNRETLSITGLTQTVAMTGGSPDTVQTFFVEITPTGTGTDVHGVEYDYDNLT